MRFFCAILAVGLLIELRVRAELVDGIRVVVHNSVVTYLQVESSIAPLVESLRRQHAGAPTALQAEAAKLRDESTERMIESQLILREFETAGYTFPESVIDDIVRQRIREEFSDRATLTRSLQAEGITYERYRKRLRERFIIEQMQMKNVSDALVISPHKIELYYVTHTNDFKVEEQVKLRMIVRNKGSDDSGEARKLADEVLTKVNEGASFAEMARGYSQGQNSARGGDWDWVSRSVLRKELDDVAFSLKPGEKSGVIETPDACYLMLVEDKRMARVRPLNEVRNEIEQELLRQERNRLRQQWVERLKKKTFLRYF